MTITELKNNLQITDVGEHLGISIGKSDKACCPFHNDKTPSFQFSKEKQIVTCFSSNCDFGTKDAIGLTEKKLNLNTHEAINYLKENCINSSLLIMSEPTKAKEEINYKLIFEQLESTILNSKVPKEYLEQRGLDYKQIQIGYNPFKGQKWEKLRGCIAFPLRDKENNIVSIYGRSVRNNDKAKHYYTTDRKGLYPKYPPVETKKLILTESIIDAETLIQQKVITKDFEILALYGTNGLTKLHLDAMEELTKLDEVILFFDGDEAGTKATEKYARELENKNLTISTVSTPQNEDINSLFVNYGVDCLLDLINNRENYLKVEQPIVHHSKAVNRSINTENLNDIIYITERASYHIRGGIRKDLDSLKVSLQIQHHESKVWSRTKLDLYEDKQTEKFARQSAEKLSLRADLVERDIDYFTNLIDDYRLENESITKETKEDKIQLTVEETKELKSFGKSKGLLKKVNDLVGKSGVVGEESNRLFLFTVAVSHLMKKPLNVVVQGSSGSGKSYIIKKVSDLVPQEKVKRYTRLSEKSFYNFGEYDLCNRLIIIEDYDGMNEEVEYAFREIQSNGTLISAISAKEHDNADIQTKDKIVRGPIASMVATTKGEIYHDNSTRVFFISVDESKEQTQKIIDYKNKKANGEIKQEDEDSAKEYLQKFVSTLKPYRVKNPYLKQINLPVPHDQLRRLHELLEAFSAQITLIHQHQRTIKDNYVITEKEDMTLAIDLLFDSIVLKVDELNGSLRDFYERLKTYILEKGKDYEFTRIEVRKALNMSKTKQHQYMNQLLELEYIFQSSGYANKGFRYRIDYWDDNEKLRKQIRESLNKQLSKL
jgi:DNA primase